MKSQAKMIALLCIVSLGLFPVWFLFRGEQIGLESHGEIRHFMARAQLGDTKAQIRQKFKAGSYKVLVLLEKPNDEWTVNSPGLGNWLLHLEFYKDEVRAMRLGTGDSPSRRPDDSTAPPDKIAPGWPQKFPRN
jgi:hypothetical protein